MKPYSLGVSLEDYQLGADGSAFGNSMNTQEELAEINKALEADEITGRDTDGSLTASGAPLKVESLEQTLKVITWKETDIRFWKEIPKLPAYNTVEEYNQLVSYGEDRGGFNNEGELPEEEDSVYRRQSQLVKFMGVTKSVTHPMQLVRVHIGDIMQREIKNGTLWLLHKADRALMFANENLIPQEFNGLNKQHYDAYGTLTSYHDSASVLDLRGDYLDEKDIEDACLGIIENHGEPNLLMGPPSILNDFVNRFYSKKLIAPNSPQVTAGVMGQKVNEFQSQFGMISLGYDKFLKNGSAKTIATVADSNKAPAVIVPDGITPLAANAADTGTKFAGFGGDYYYGVAAVNRYGESAVKLLSNAKLTIAVTESAALKFTDGGGAYPATAYVVYRSAKNEAAAFGVAKLYPIFTVSKAELAAGYDGAGGANIIWDRNRYIQNCESALLIQSDEEVYSFKQLAPLMKMDLAILAPATRFMILMYGTPVVYAPKKMVRIINIGRA